METSPIPSSSKPAKLPTPVTTREQRQQRQITAIIIGAVIIILFILIAGVIFLLNQPLSNVTRIRDIFIIVLALESLMIGLVLIILIVQIARLTNLLQNEIKPILDTTNETVSNLRGTTVFLSDNLIEPVIKLNEYLAALRRMLELIKLSRKN